MKALNVPINNVEFLLPKPKQEEIDNNKENNMKQ
jgi:hypothetical protein